MWNSVQTQVLCLVPTQCTSMRFSMIATLSIPGNDIQRFEGISCIECMLISSPDNSSASSIYCKLTPLSHLVNVLPTSLFCLI